MPSWSLAGRENLPFLALALWPSSPENYITVSQVLVSLLADLTPLTGGYACHLHFKRT